MDDLAYVDHHIEVMILVVQDVLAMVYYLVAVLDGYLGVVPAYKPVVALTELVEAYMMAALLVMC